MRIAGTGPEEAALRALAGPTVEFLGRVGEAELKRSYATCRALLFAADEDFGLVSVEAQAFGRPVIAYGRGGSLETVRGLWMQKVNGGCSAMDYSKYSGVFFPQQTVSSLVEAISNFEHIEGRFDPGSIQSNARRFDTAVFVAGIRGYVEERMESRRTSR